MRLRRLASIVLALAALAAIAFVLAPSFAPTHPFPTPAPTRAAGGPPPELRP